MSKVTSVPASTPAIRKGEKVLEESEGLRVELGYREPPQKRTRLQAMDRRLREAIEPVKQLVYISRYRTVDQEDRLRALSRDLQEERRKINAMIRRYGRRRSSRLERP